MQPTLLVGPADWDPARLPKQEFLARIAAFWRRCPAAAGAIVYGGRAQHAELAYLTNFTPKLEAALALIPRVGAAQLLVGGGPNMLQAAKPLTFIEKRPPPARCRRGGRAMDARAERRRPPGADRRRRHARPAAPADRRGGGQDRGQDRRSLDADASQERTRARGDARGPALRSAWRSTR